MEEGRYLNLEHNLFDDDAIVLKEMPREVTLESAKGSKKITVAFPDMDYLGICFLLNKLHLIIRKKSVNIHMRNLHWWFLPRGENFSLSKMQKDRNTCGREMLQHGQTEILPPWKKPPV